MTRAAVVSQIGSGSRVRVARTEAGSPTEANSAEVEGVSRFGSGFPGEVGPNGPDAPTEANLT